MINEELIYNSKNNILNHERILKNIQKIPEINECEYIYIDDINNQNMKSSFFKNKIIITQNTFNEYMMFTIEDILDNGHINNITKLDSKQIVDLMILNSDTQKDMENLIDQDTIITKYLGDNIVYMEDHRHDIYIFITENERLVIKGRGTKTQMLYHEKSNT